LTRETNEEHQARNESEFDAIPEKCRIIGKLRRAKCSGEHECDIEGASEINETSGEGDDRSDINGDE
jgi:hypothetical protein